jgi:lipopolysaccharide export LptBFGC system permease protein LptF
MQQSFLCLLCLTFVYRLLGRALKEDGGVPFFVLAVLMLVVAALCR